MFLKMLAKFLLHIVVLLATLNIFVSFANAELIEFTSNAAGHGGMIKNTTAGLLYKPLIEQDHEWFVNEYIKFKHPVLYDEFMPKIHDITTLESYNVTLNFLRTRDFVGNFMMMQDITQNYSNPQSMDIKVGVTVKKFVPSYYYITGYTDKRFRDPEKYDNTKDDDRLQNFFRHVGKDDNIGGTTINMIIDSLIAQLSRLRVLIREVKILLRNVSILIVYDAEHQNNTTPTLDQIKPRVWLIDVARSTGREYENPPRITIGIDNIITSLKKFGEKRSEQTVYLIRHGERLDYHDPAWVIGAGAVNPHDPPLSESGQKQSNEIGHAFSQLVKQGAKMDCIVTSPFRRAMETAMIVSQYIPNSNLYYDFGFAEFMSSTSRTKTPKLSDIYSPYFDSINSKTGYRQIYHEMTLETWDGLKNRTAESLYNTMKHCKNPIIVAHRSTLQGLTSKIFDREFTELMEYGSYSVMNYSENRFDLQKYNIREHLKTFIKSPYSNPNYRSRVYNDIQYENVHYEESGTAHKIPWLK